MQRRSEKLEISADAFEAKFNELVSLGDEVSTRRGEKNKLEAEVAALTERQEKLSARMEKASSDFERDIKLIRQTRDELMKIAEMKGKYEKAVEDMEWCRRAAEKEIDGFIFPEVRVFKIAPQQRGALSVQMCTAMERSLEKLVERTRSPVYSMLYRSVRRAKWLCTWLAVLGVRGLMLGGSPWLQQKATVYRALLGWGKRPDEPPADAESNSRWEAIV